MRQLLRSLWQFELPFAAPAPQTADDFRNRLRTFGLGREYRCRLTRNRTVVVSYRGSELRVHRDFLTAPEDVCRAIVAFVQGPTRRARVSARRVILAYPIDRSTSVARRSPERTHPADEPLVARLRVHFEELNAERFGGVLRPIAIRVSRRMRTKLGCYTLATAVTAAEIVISRRHIRRHGWDEVVATLLHEMVHQWQAESGQSVDHGREFRVKAREVGIFAGARRAVA